MKKLFLIIFGFLIINSLLAQPIGDKWYYDYQTPVSTGYTLIEYTNDTIINSSQYRILNKTQFTYNFPGFYDTTELNCEYIKWNSDTVYRYLDGNDYVLYNFNKNVGDTISFYYKSTFSACDSIGKAIVDSVGYINIASVSRNWISVSCFSNSHLCINGKIVEGIGPIEDYFFPEIYNCVIDVNEGGPFRCLWDESNLIFIKTTAQCDYINYVEDNNDINIVVSPNPFSDIMRIENNNPYNIEYVIYNSLGQKMTMPAKINSFSSQSINMEGLHSGIYYIQIRSENTKQTSLKIIKY